MALVLEVKNTFFTIKTPEEDAGESKTKRCNSLPRSWRLKANLEKHSDVSDSSTIVPDDISLPGDQSSDTDKTSDDGVTGGTIARNCAGCCGAQKTRLKLSARAFEPATEEIQSVIAAVKLALFQNPHTSQVHVQEGGMGSTTTIIAEVYCSEWLSNAGACETMILQPARDALLDATTRSRGVYALGYANEPFENFYDLGFKANLSVMPMACQDTACWDFYMNGFCPRPSTCRWKHPGTSDLMEISVLLREAQCGYDAGAFY
jgi:hypothetical protein